ncbi:Pentatricopeptide repeat-containing protein At2g13600 [Linum perenne]
MNLIKISNLSASVKPSTRNPTLTHTILDTLLQRCRSLSHFNQIVSQMIITGFLDDTFAAGKLLKFSTDSLFIPLTHSHRIFTHIRNPNGFVYNTMMRAHVQRNNPEQALLVYKLMRGDSVGPDTYTYPLLLQSCSQRLAEFQGRLIHGHVFKVGFDSDVYVQNTLINLYAVCGKLGDARQVFDESPVLDLVSWNSMLAGLAMNGMVKESLETFSEMKECGILPNEITFLAVLGACRHMGLVDEGRRHFDSMVEDHGIKPTVKHYGCMVDLLGRAGKLREAEELIDSMPMAPDVSTWGALLGACTKYEDNVMGERVGRKLIEFQPDHDGFHVLLSNIYASRGDWNDAHEVRGTMRKHRVVKMPGCSMIEANGIVHEFSTPSD